MRIHATFVQHVTGEIELVHAWDEYCLDDNMDGYLESLDRELATYSEGGKRLPHVTALLEVDYEAIEHLFTHQPLLKVKVVDP